VDSAKWSELTSVEKLGDDLCGGLKVSSNVEVTKVARLGKSKLLQLNKDNLTNREKAGFGKGSAVDRTRISTTKYAPLGYSIACFYCHLVLAFT
jgi:hypothetical protein